MNYRFKFQIIEDDSEAEVLKGSIFISEEISESGDNETVDVEVGRAMRQFKKIRADKRNEESAEEHESKQSTGDEE